MKKLTILLFLFSVSFYSYAQKSKVKKGPTKELETAMGKGVLLSYAGFIDGGESGKLEISYRLVMDSRVGFRCDMVLTQGDGKISDVAIFYKFSSPHTFIFYNLFTHKYYEKAITTGDDLEGLTAVGKEMVDTFSCTHLQYKDKSSEANYWMSTDVPGYSSIWKILKAIGIPLFNSTISGAIFQWGGLVKLHRSNTSSDGTVTATISLIHADPNFYFPLKDLDPPRDKKN